MIATLQSSVKKMNDLLARLSPKQIHDAFRAAGAMLDSVVFG